MGKNILNTNRVLFCHGSYTKEGTGAGGLQTWHKKKA
jgi:hypothetical protein